MRYAIGLAALLAVGCQGRTEIVVGVVTDLKAKNQIDHVEFFALRDGKTVIDTPWDLADVPAGNYELPGSFGIYSPDGNQPRLELQVQGSRAGALVVQRSSIVSLITGQTLFMRLGLVGDCSTIDGPSCSDGESCVEGVCRAEEIDPHRLPRYRQELVASTECASGTSFVVSSTGVPMASLGTDCPADEYCQEGVCLKRLPSDSPPPSTSPDWVDTSDPSPQPLRALSGSEDSGNLVAAGEGGVVLDGTGGNSDPGWMPQSSGVTTTLFGTWEGGPDDTFTVGSGGVILHRHGGVWTPEPLPAGASVERLNAIWGASLDDIWAVGRAPGNLPVALHRIGGVWLVDASLSGPSGLAAVWGRATGDVWAAGSGSHLQHFDGSTWRQITVEAGHDFQAITGSGGAVFLVGRHGLIARATLSGITIETVDKFTTDLFAVWSGAPNALYAVGDYGKILFSTGDGTWSEQVSGTEAALFAVFGLRNKIYAAGRLGKILSSDGLTVGGSDGGAPVDMAMPECVSTDECATSCTGFTLLSRSCQAGHCTDGASSPCGGGFICADTIACKSACALDDDCQPGNYCDSTGSCSARVAQGSACNVDAGGDCKAAGCRECGDGFFCTDHVCCDKSPAQCGGCSQCSAPTGTCGPVTAGTDPHGACTTMTAECTQTKCNGRGTCNNTGNACGTDSCAASQLTKHNCADGVCTADAAVPCANSSPCANATSCAGKCADDTACPTGYYCDASGDCAAQKAKSGVCNLAVGPSGHCKVAGCRECGTSTQCVDGYCCDAACAGACQACDVATKEGTCSQVTSGQPHGARTTCVTAVPTCGAGFCSNNPTACSYPTGACGTDSCTGASDTTHSCLGGTCNANPPTACTTGYLCGSATACAISCTSDAQCDTANDYFCNASGVCAMSHAPGAICNLAGECKSGNCHLCKGTNQCAFGVCCASACAGQCQMCNTSGQCVGVASGQPVQGRPTCSTDGTSCSSCAGGPACANASTSTRCGGPVCSTDHTSESDFCNGTGSCGGAVDTQCGATSQYACASGVCNTTCNVNADCASTPVQFTCQLQQHYCGFPNGHACKNAAQCGSGYCSVKDDACCNEVCTAGSSGDSCTKLDVKTGEYHATGRVSNCKAGACAVSAIGDCLVGWLCIPSVGSCPLDVSEGATCACDNVNDTHRTACASSSCDSAAGYNCDRTASACQKEPVK